MWAGSGQRLVTVLGAKHNRAMDSSGMARALGSKGGKARAKRLAPAEKQRIAALGGRARALSIHAERRIAENFRYVEVIDALQPRPKAISQRRFAGSLPDIHVPQDPPR
jgi:hypothetical protein